MSVLNPYHPLTYNHDVCNYTHLMLVLILFQVSVKNVRRALHNPWQKFVNATVFSQKKFPINII